MTFKKFEELLHSKYPEAQACAHGKFGGTEKNGKTEIHFRPNGKCYEYYGSYQDVLRKVGILVLYESDVEWARKKLVQLKEEHGKPNKYSLFFFDDDHLVDNTREIAEYEEYLADIDNGKYIVVKG